MIHNKMTLRDHIEDEKLISKILRKATRYNIAFDRMQRNKKGAIYPMIHFELDKWLEAHRNAVNNTGAGEVKANHKMLEIMEGLV